MSRYIDEFIRLSCAPDLLALKLFPNAKEITESLGAYNAVRQHLWLNFGDSSICVLVVGDGVVPRTAATFAFRSRWTCYSVDPRMRDNRWDLKVQRLHVFRAKVLPENGWAPPIHCNVFSQCILVAVHSHASLSASIQAARMLSTNVSVVSIPCCVKHDYHAMPNHEYDDWSIASPERRVSVWRQA